MNVSDVYEKLCRLFEREVGERVADGKGNQMPSLQSRLLADKVMHLLMDEGFEPPSTIELKAVRERLGLK